MRKQTYSKRSRTTDNHFCFKGPFEYRYLNISQFVCSSEQRNENVVVKLRVTLRHKVFLKLHKTCYNYINNLS